MVKCSVNGAEENVSSLKSCVKSKLKREVKIQSHSQEVDILFSLICRQALAF